MVSNYCTYCRPNVCVTCYLWRSPSIPWCQTGRPVTAGCAPGPRVTTECSSGKSGVGPMWWCWLLKMLSHSNKSIQNKDKKYPKSRITDRHPANHARWAISAHWHDVVVVVVDVWESKLSGTNANAAVAASIYNKANAVRHGMYAHLLLVSREFAVCFSGWYSPKQEGRNVWYTRAHRLWPTQGW